MDIIGEHRGNHEIAIISFPRIFDHTGIVTSEYHGFTIITEIPPTPIYSV